MVQPNDSDLLHYEASGTTNAPSTGDVLIAAFLFVGALVFLIWGVCKIGRTCGVW